MSQAVMVIPVVYIGLLIICQHACKGQYEEESNSTELLMSESSSFDLTSSNVPQVEPENGHADLAVAIAVPIVLLLVVITLTTVLATIILFIILKRQRRNKSYSTGKQASNTAVITNKEMDDLSPYEEMASAPVQLSLYCNTLVSSTSQVSKLSENLPDEAYEEVAFTPSRHGRSNCFWQPSSNPAKLYEQLKKTKFVEIPHSDIEVHDKIGQGNFGTVSQALWKESNIAVAVKILKNSSSESDKIRFLQEAVIMGQFRHPNVVKLHGVVTTGEPVMIVAELMSNNDLKNYLPKLSINVSLPSKLYDFCRQVAIGMKYLSSKSFVHRDLAARNILVSDECICKIGDFGMARDLMDESYYISKGGRLPVKWTSPEALHYKKYSTASDVWSYGVLLFEIWSLGKTPYGDKKPLEVVEFVDSGHRLAPPPGCPEMVYSLMIQCWNPTASERPTFNIILDYFSDSSQMKLDCPQLGGDLEEKTSLYKDLQQKYFK